MFCAAPESPFGAALFFGVVVLWRGMSLLHRLRILASGCLLAFVLCVASFAHAAPIGQATPADKAAARDAYRDGQQLVSAQDYRRALVAFKRGYASYEDPIFLFNIAQCERLLGEKEQAVRYYRAFLERVPEPPNLADVQRWLARLDAQIEADRNANVDRPAPQGDEPAARPVDEPVSSDPVPVYKKWWLWTIVGVVVAGGALGVGLGLGLRGPPTFNQTLTDFGPGATKTTSTLVQVRF